MNTLKSAALVVVLLAVLYGVFVALSKPDRSPFATPASEHDEELAPPLVDFSMAETPVSATAAPTSLPMARGHEAMTSPAEAASRSPRGSAIAPDLDSPDSLPPPTSVPSTDPPLDPTAAAGSDLRRSSYESPAYGATSQPGSAYGGSASESPAVTLPSTSPPAGEATQSAPGRDNEPPPGNSASLTAWSLRQDLQAAEQLVAGGKFRDALARLSPYYAKPELGPDDRAALVAWLDALAAKVIYSREHLLAYPHKVRSGESLFDIGGQYQVGWQLLQSINGLTAMDPRVLVPGTELKIVPGPFRAELSLSAGELTLYAGELYAGRFPLAVGNEPPSIGSFKVLDKREDRTYYGLDGRMIPANDPNNPYGGRWISLGGEVCIHGSPLAPTSQTLGCISLSPQDARDVYGILTVGSEVTIRR